MGGSGNISPMNKVKFKTTYTDGLIFGEVKEYADYIDINGYSNATTTKQAYKELASVVENFDKDEADAIRQLHDDGGNIVFPPRKGESPAQYILEVEEVTTANNTLENHAFGNKRKGRKLKGYEVNNGVESADSRWYLHVRFLK